MFRRLLCAAQLLCVARCLCRKHFNTDCFNLQLEFDVPLMANLSVGVTSIQLWAEDEVPRTNPVFHNPDGWTSNVPIGQFLSGGYTVLRNRVCDLNKDGKIYIALHALTFACGNMAGGCGVRVEGMQGVQCILRSLGVQVYQKPVPQQVASCRAGWPVLTVDT